MSLRLLFSILNCTLHMNCDFMTYDVNMK